MTRTKNELGKPGSKEENMYGAVNPLSAARYMCERSGWSLTNLKLQKMLYLAQMLYMGPTHGRLINGTFEAWDYGPVLPEVYTAAKMYGAGPITSGFHYVPPMVDENRKQWLEYAYNQLGGMPASQLVAITHEPGGAWYKAYQPGAYHIPISDADIIQEYNDRFANRDAQPA